MKRSFAAWVLAALALLAAGAPWIAPAPPDLQEDVAGARLLPPGTRARALALRGGRTLVLTELRRSGGDWEGMRAGRPVTIEGPESVAEPSRRFYLLGTDALGRDLASQVLYALRQSLLVAGLSVALSLLLGTAVGACAGLGGGWLDALLMRGVDVLLAIPRLLLFLVVAVSFRPSLPLLVLVLGGTTWPALARLVRGEVLRRKGSDLAAAARAEGCSRARIFVRHLLPQAAPVLVVTCALRFADTIVLESALSFLGLGAPPPAVSLGGIIASGREDFARGWWIVVWPVALLSVLVIALRSTAAEALGEPPSVA